MFANTSADMAPMNPKKGDLIAVGGRHAGGARGDDGQEQRDLGVARHLRDGR